MAATGKTPILLYGSTTATNAPVAGNLTNSSDGCEIAINVADKNLFFKDATNTVNTVPIRQSSASSNGWLSSTDWSTFNGKAPAFTYTSNYIPYGQGTTTPTQSSSFVFDGTNLGVGASTTVGKITATSSTASTVTNGLTLDNPGGGGGNGIAVNFYASNSAQPFAGRINTLDDGNYGYHLVFSSKNAGSASAALTERVRMWSSGGVSIGNTTDPGAGNLSVKNIYYKNSVSAGTSGTPVSEIALQYGSSSTSAGAALKFWNIYQNTSRSWLSLACANDSGTVDDYLTVHPYNGIYVSGNLYPNTDNANSCGQSSNRWTVVYATTGTINTSDGNQKQQIRELLEAELAVAKRCKSLIRAFKFNEAVDSKGNAARIHFGVIAQHIAEAFAAEGLNAEEYGVFCKDIVYKIGKESVMPDNNGKYPEEAVATEQLGVRYEELFAFIIAAL